MQTGVLITIRLEPTSTEPVCASLAFRQSTKLVLTIWGNDVDVKADAGSRLGRYATPHSYTTS